MIRSSPTTFTIYRRLHLFLNSRSNSNSNYQLIYSLYFGKHIRLAMGATSSVVSSNENFEHSFGVIPTGSSNNAPIFASTRSQRQKFVENPKLRSNISRQVSSLLSNGLGQHIVTSETGLSRPSLRQNESTQDCKVENFMDSVYVSNWLNKEDADGLYDCLAVIGEKNRPKDILLANLQRSKYPLWTKYYGLKRQKDGARALDRWGSYHESWIRVEEPPALLVDVAKKLRTHFHLPEDAVNSMVVNYYYDGDNTYIPAHRDTTACLEENSHVICLSLGASRDFVLCANEDAGKFDKEDMTIVREWRVQHGDIFAIGKTTNEDYCHAVTRELGLSKMRISVIFRSIDKSFITYDCEEKIACYKSGKTKAFRAECIATKHYQDEGIREHIADLINAREETKRRNAAVNTKSDSPTIETAPQSVVNENTVLNDQDVDYRRRYEEELYSQNLKKELQEEGVVALPPASSTVLASYYMGKGVAVLNKSSFST